MGFRVFRVEGLGFSYHFDVSDPIINSRKCLGFGVWGLGFRVEGLGFSYHFDVLDPLIDARKPL